MAEKDFIPFFKEYFKFFFSHTHGTGENLSIVVQLRALMNTDV